MKTILKIFAAAVCGAILLPATFTGCTDVGGDGIDSVLWTGSVNPQNTGYRNPVWEPSLEAGTVLKGASMYVAISATTQWAAGLTYYCPALTSSDLMSWTKASAEAFSEETVPSWGGRVTSVSADFAKTFSGTNKYWLFYTVEGKDSIGYANASSPQGVYNDFGSLELKDNPTGVKDPFFFVQAKNYYLCYSTDDGTYIQKVTLNSKAGVTLGSAANPEKIADAGFTDVAVMANSASDLYIFGMVGGEIHYARAEAYNGPYTDKSGVSLVEGGTGEKLITPSAEYSEISNPMRAFLNGDGTYVYLAYNAVETDKTVMASGYVRAPMFMQPMELDEDGWFTSVYSPATGWVTPRFE